MIQSNLDGTRKYRLRLGIIALFPMRNVQRFQVVFPKSSVNPIQREVCPLQTQHAEKATCIYPSYYQPL